MYSTACRALLQTQSSNCPLRYRWDDHSDLNTSVDVADIDGSSNDEDDLAAKATTPKLDIELPIMLILNVILHGVALRQFAL